MKKGLGTKIFASIALFGIFIGIVGTAIIFIATPKEISGPTSSNQEKKLTPEQLESLQEIVNMSGVTIGGAGTGTNISTGEVNGK